MRIKLRFSLRALLILVGMVALEFGLATELQNRRGRDANLAAAAKHRSQLAWHRDQADRCRESIAQGRPYPIRERNAVHRRATRSLDIPILAFPCRDWAGELTYHRYWADWHATEADEAARKQQHYQRRLLWPF